MNWNSHFRSGFHPKLSEIVKKLNLRKLIRSYLLRSFRFLQQMELEAEDKSDVQLTSNKMQIY
uniref:Uncharacterized protein n=1 Tax=Meloidogyne enterolobii TaxID=390850 RepID=A0A6V7XAT5_MELEN|nr:unnamed protein product [Meloidogyne enterolobii]